MTEASRRSERREHERTETVGEVEVGFDSGSRNCELADISPGGAFVKSTTYPKIGEVVTFRLRDVGQVKSRVVRHHDQGFAVTFDALDEQGKRIVGIFRERLLG